MVILPGLSDAEQTRGRADDVETTRNRDRLSRGRWIARRPGESYENAGGDIPEKPWPSHGPGRGLVKAVRTGGRRTRALTVLDTVQDLVTASPSCSGKAHGPGLSAHGCGAPQHTATRTSSSVSSCSGGGMTSAITLQARLVALASRRRTRQELSTSIDLEPDYVIATPLYNDVPHLVLPYALRLPPEKAEAHRLQAAPASECRGKPGHHSRASCLETPHFPRSVFMMVFTISDAVPGCGSRARSCAMADNCTACSSTTSAMCRNARIMPWTSP